MSHIEDSHLCVFPGGCTSKARRRGLCTAHGKVVAPSVTEQVVMDRMLAKFRSENTTLRGKYNKALKDIEQLEEDLGLSRHLKQHLGTFKIRPSQGHGTSEATPILIASDWHMEQRVRKEETSGLNEFTLDIAHARAERFFTAGLRLIRLLNQDVKIETVMIPLLGDFITGQIHGAANAENNKLKPTEALVFAQKHLASGIEFFLNHSTYNLVLPCKVGNHSRTTETSRFGGENGHNYEYLMYLQLQAYFAGEARVKFIIEDGYLTYVDIYKELYRFHHGHSIRTQGGVGGLFPPTYKKIMNWNKGRTATRDVFGHHHQYLGGGNFHCNGSLIGYDGRTEALAYGFEPPVQTLLLVDKKRGETAKWPVLLEKP